MKYEIEFFVKYILYINFLNLLTFDKAMTNATCSCLGYRHESVPYPWYAATLTAHRVDARIEILCRAMPWDPC